MENNYLIHFGVKGQHWGVRRYQNADGSYTEAGQKRYTKKYGEISTIKAGTKVYRTSGDKNEDVGGNKYVTYFKNDTKYYRGVGAQWVAATQNKSVRELYANTYKTTGPIQVATSKTVNQTLNDMTKKDPKLADRMADGFSSMMMRNRGASENTLNLVREANKLNTTKQQNNLYAKDFKKQYEEYSNQCRENGIKPINEATAKNNYINSCQTVRDYYNGYKQRALDGINGSNQERSAFYKTAALGRPELQDVKDNLIKNLGNKGYGAMTDIAGVGGAGTGRETRQALIIFNTDTTLSKMKSESIMKYYSSSKRTYKDPGKGKYKNLMLM